MSDQAETTDAEVLALIRDCYAGSLDPEDEKISMTRHERFCQGAGGNPEWIGGAVQHPVPDYEWSAERAADLLYNDVSEERLSELEDGAEPTSDEIALYRTAAENDVNEFDGYAAYVHRLTAAEDSGEKRPVFFVWVGKGTGQSVDEVGHAGPYTNLTDLAGYLSREHGVPDEWWVDKPFPEADQMKTLPVLPGSK